MDSPIERIARALESIAESLVKLANPLVKVDAGQIDWRGYSYRAHGGEGETPPTYPFRVVALFGEKHLDPEANRRPWFTLGDKD